MEKMMYEHVLTPIQIGPMRLKNRVSFTPVWPSFATGDGHVNRELMEWVRDIAKGGVACINVGCGCVNRNIPSAVTHLLRMSEETVVNEMIALTDLAHMYNAKIGMELFAINFYGGSFEERDKGKKVAVELDPTYLTKEQLKELIEDFANAAERAKRCGFDSLVIHGAHGQLPGCFLSKVINQRIDEYSADTIENATRFTNELLTAVREKVGNTMAIEYRINASDMVEGSPTLEDEIAFVHEIEDKIDLLHVSRGLHAMQNLAPYMNQPLYYPHGINLEDAAKIKEEVKVPVTVVGSVTLEQAESYIRDGKLDMVSMARGLMADPYMVKNACRNRTERTRPCIRCNNCINRTHYYMAPVRCSVNAEMGMETLYMNTGNSNRKRVAVIGAGAAGLEAARTAANRGHEVVLFEKTNQLGGVLNIAAAPEFKNDLKNYLEWSIRSVKMDHRIKIKKNIEVTANILEQENFEVVLVAVGSKPVIPDNLNKNDKIVWVGDVEMEKVQIGSEIVIAGAGLTGCECALNLAMQGKNVTVADMIPEEEFGRGGAKFNQLALVDLLKKNGVIFKGKRKLMEVTQIGAVFEKENGEKEILPCDQAVLSLGVRPDAEVLKQFETCASEVRFLGDCATKAGNLYYAVHSAHEAATTV